MARKLALKIVPLSGRLVNGSPPLDYGDVLLRMLRVDQSGGMTFSDIEKRVDAITPIQAALDNGLDQVTLTDAQWLTVKEKLDRYLFGIADQAVLDFARMIQNAEEIGT